jgi:uncharacterized delta-60 repeat protein
MRNAFMTICTTVALIASSAHVVQAEQLDSSYNGSGRYVEGFGSNTRNAVVMLETHSGGIVQVSSQEGGCGGSPTCPAMTYLTGTGTFVISYGGFLTASNGLQSITAAAIDSHDRIIVAGASTPSVGGRNFRVLRYLPNGDADTSFAGDGNTDVDFFGQDDYATAVAVDANDNIIVVGQVTISATDTDFGVARLRGSDGAPDTSFSGDGKATALFDLGASQRFDAAKAVAIAASGGRISVVGIAYDSAISRYRVALARFSSDGALDTTFCAASCTVQGSYTSINNGRRVYYFGSNTAHSDTAAGIALAGNGDFFIVGETYSTNGSDKRAAIARFAANGDYAAEALNDGLGNNAAYRSVRLSDANGQRVLVAGDSGPESNYLLLQAFSFGLTPLTGYGDCLNTTAFCLIGGTGLGDNGPDAASALTLDRSGRPLFAGTFIASSGDFGKSLFARFTNTTGPKPDLIFRNGFQ